LGLRVLLVDDASVTGVILNTVLTGKGRADFVLFPNVFSCGTWLGSVS
jgi:hypothetical protein